MGFEKILDDENIDISEIEKLMNKQMRLQRLSVIGELASRMAHDMRNPLSVIKMSIDNTVLLYGAKPEAKKNFQKINRAIERIAHQIDDVLDFVREKELRKEILVLSEIIPEILSTFSLPTTITLNISVQESKIEFDKTMFYAVIKNLVINAIQACENKGRIDIQTREDDISILIEVKDSGPGMSPKTIKRIFEPLFTTKQTGTGLGLASCKSMVEQHNGTLNVRTNPTVFTVMLPKRAIHNNL